MRFPLGLLAQYMGRKTATLVEMGLITLAMAFGFFFVHSYDDLLAMGVLLGMWPAPASAWRCRWVRAGTRRKYKGLAMGLVGAGNVGTALAALLAPPLALKFGWQAVYGIAAIASAVPMLVVAFMAKEPPDRDEHASLKEHMACLLEKDGWAFSLIYVVTFRRLHRPHHLFAHLLLRPVRREQGAGRPAHHAGRADGRRVRVFGGWISDHWGGVNTLTVVLVVPRTLVGVRPGRPIRWCHHAAADRLLCRARRRQRRAVPAGAAALAHFHRRGRLHDRRDRRPGRRPGAHAHGPGQAAHRQLPHRLRRAGRVLAADAGRDAHDAGALDTNLGRERRSGADGLKSAKVRKLHKPEGLRTGRATPFPIQCDRPVTVERETLKQGKTDSGQILSLEVSKT
jgi:hypothetical protein